MSRLLYSLRQLRYRRTSSILTMLSVSLAVALVIAILATVGGMREGILGSMGHYDLVVGKTGSETQLILSTIFHIDNPLGNIPFSYVEKLSADARVKEVIPVGLGDMVQGYRMLGTTPAYLTASQLAVAEGKLFDAPDEAVLGAVVAKALGLKLGDEFVSSHGISQDGGSDNHDHELEYIVVGILAPTGTPSDRLVFTSLESIWLVHGLLHDEDHDDDHDEEDCDDEDHDHGHEHDDEDGLPVTAILIKPNGPAEAMQLRRELNEESGIQAVFAIAVVRKVLEYLGTGGYLLLGVAFVSVIVSSLALFISMASAAVERKRDVAVLRALGAKRTVVFGLVCLEAVLIAIVGSAVGYVLGQLTAFGIRLWVISASGITPGFVLINTYQLLALLIAVALGTAAGLVPALTAYRLEPTKHLS